MTSADADEGFREKRAPFNHRLEASMQRSPFLASPRSAVGATS
jgi:hypothetical protein